MNFVRPATLMALIGLLLAGGLTARPRAASIHDEKIERYKSLLLEELSLLEVLEELQFAEERGIEEQARLELEIGRQRGALARERAALDGVAAQLEIKRGAVRENVRRILLARKRRALSPLFEQDELIAALKTRRYFDRIITRNQQDLSAYAALAGDHEAAVAEHEERLLRVEEMREDLEAELARIQDSIATRKEILRRLDSEERLFSKYQAELAAAEKKLTVRVRKLKNWQEQRLGFPRFRGKLRVPMTPSALEIRYGPRKLEGFATETFHHGVSFKARLLEETDPRAVKVRAVYWGRVAFAGWIRGYGRTVILDHGSGYHSVYAHLDQLVVEEGDVMKIRESVATVDTTRGGDDALLYFELRRDGETINPTHWFQ
jgi:murein hydrolase activator